MKIPHRDVVALWPWKGRSTKPRVQPMVSRRRKPALKGSCKNPRMVLTGISYPTEFGAIQDVTGKQQFYEREFNARLMGRF